MKEFFEEYGSAVLTVVGAIVIIGIVALLFLNNGTIAAFVLKHLNAAF